MADNASTMEFIETPVFTKAKKENLEPAQITILKALVKELERHG